jgi:hypothetical protein
MIKNTLVIKELEEGYEGLICVNKKTRDEKDGRKEEEEKKKTERKEMLARWQNAALGGF